MRAATPLVVTFLATMLAACGGGARDFEADFAAAQANVATLDGGAFAHATRQRMTTPGIDAATNQCIHGSQHKTPGYRGVIGFEAGGGYSVRFEADDENARCLVGLFEGRDLPEPPSRPYLIPIEAGVTK